MLMLGGSAGTPLGPWWHLAGSLLVPCWRPVGLSWLIIARFGKILGHLGAILKQVWTISGHLVPIVGILGMILGPSWIHLRLSEGYLGSS